MGKKLIHFAFVLSSEGVSWQVVKDYSTILILYAIELKYSVHSLKVKPY